MLATFGLERLEKGLARDAVTSTDVAEFLDQAGAQEVGTLVRQGMPEALDYLHRRRAQRTIGPALHAPPGGKHRADTFFTTTLGAVGPGLSAQQHQRSRANPQFRATPHVNHV
ncbi:hypothetical protein [Mycobacterium botniense]|nr:hypothetical protein [Mycobacterium botniense]